MSDDLAVIRLGGSLTPPGRPHSPRSIRRIARWVCSAYKPGLRPPSWQEGRAAPRCISPARAAKSSDCRRLPSPSQTYWEV